MDGERVFVCTLSSALNQYTTVTTIRVLDQITYVTVHPMISVEIQNAEKYIPSGYVSEL